MSTALALTASHLATVRTPGSGERPIAKVSVMTRAPTSYVYGDSTPFPYECNYIEIAYRAIACSVALMTAEQALSRATTRSGEAGRRRGHERAALLGIADACKRALLEETGSSSERVARTAARLLASTRGAVEAEIAAVEAEAQREIAGATTAADEARKTAFRALEAFARRDDLPGTEVALRLTACDPGYAAEAVVTTPYGLDAAFDVRIDEKHPWSTLFRVGDLGGPIVLHIPKDTGWFSKRVELKPKNLAKMVVRAVALGPGRCMLTVGKGARVGAGYKIDVDARGEGAPKIRVRVVREDGVDGQPQPFEIASDDRARLVRLAERVHASTGDLLSRRGAMTRAFFDGKPLATQSSPGEIAKRLVAAIAPGVVEIANRSGTPGELVLRRDAGTWRRDEVYVTKAELSELVMTLAPPMRKIFDVLELDGPRSPRAPLPSLGQYIEIGDADIVD